MGKWSAKAAHVILVVLMLNVFKSFRTGESQGIKCTMVWFTNTSSFSSGGTFSFNVTDSPRELATIASQFLTKALSEVSNLTMIPEVSKNEVLLDSTNAFNLKNLTASSTKESEQIIIESNELCWSSKGKKNRARILLPTPQFVSRLMSMQSSACDVSADVRALESAKLDALAINALGPSVKGTLSHTSSSLVLSFFYGYDTRKRSEVLQRYLGSLRAVSDADVVIVFDGGFCDEIASLYNAECVDFHLLPSFNMLQALSNATGKIALINYRFSFWADILEERHHKNYTSVLATDMRDVLFQTSRDGKGLFSKLPILTHERPLVVVGEFILHKVAHCVRNVFVFLTCCRRANFDATR